MSIEDIIKLWKTDEDAFKGDAPENPVGEELADEELLDIIGGVRCIAVCSSTAGGCPNTFTE